MKEIAFKKCRTQSGKHDEVQPRNPRSADAAARVVCYAPREDKCDTVEGRRGELTMKEDILEQIVEDYLIHNGYFVQHNVKFLPRKGHPDYERSKDSNHSDIDVIGFDPKGEGNSKVLAVTCKSWQSGFNPSSVLDAIKHDKKVGGREAWKAFRELTVRKWSEAFVTAVREATGTDRFTYVLAVAKVVGDRMPWEGHKPFRDALGGNPIRIITFQDMIVDMQSQVTTTVAASEVGRMLQLFRVAGIHVDRD